MFDVDCWLVDFLFLVVEVDYVVVFDVIELVWYGVFEEWYGVEEVKYVW